MQTELCWNILTRYIKNTPSHHSIKHSRLYKQFMTEREIIVLKNSEICKTMIDFHTDEGIILEHAGALTIGALKYLPKEDIKNKRLFV